LSLKANSRLSDQITSRTLKPLSKLQHLDLSVNASLADLTVEDLQGATLLRTLNLSNV
jgi:hypothetical protein